MIDITHHVLCVKFANFTLPSISFLYFRSFGLRLPCLPCQSLIGQFGNLHNCTILSALSPKLLLPLPIAVGAAHVAAHIAASVAARVVAIVAALVD